MRSLIFFFLDPFSVRCLQYSLRFDGKNSQWRSLCTLALSMVCCLSEPVAYAICAVLCVFTSLAIHPVFVDLCCYSVWQCELLLFEQSLFWHEVQFFFWYWIIPLVWRWHIFSIWFFFFWDVNLFEFFCGPLSQCNLIFIYLHCNHCVASISTCPWSFCQLELIKRAICTLLLSQLLLSDQSICSLWLAIVLVIWSVVRDDVGATLHGFLCSALWWHGHCCNSWQLFAISWTIIV